MVYKPKYRTFYRGTSSKDKRNKSIKKGRIPIGTWITDKRYEAVDYAKGKVESPKLYPTEAGGKPVVWTIKVPKHLNMIYMEAGGRGTAKHWATRKIIYANTSIKRIKKLPSDAEAYAFHFKSLKSRRRGT